MKEDVGLVVWDFTGEGTIDMETEKQMFGK